MRGSIREERKILVPQQTLIRGKECAFFIHGEGRGALLFKELLDSYVLIRRRGGGGKEGQDKKSRGTINLESWP